MAKLAVGCVGGAGLVGWVLLLGVLSAAHGACALEGKACNAQVACCPGLHCPSVPGSDKCVPLTGPTGQPTPQATAVAGTAQPTLVGPTVTPTPAGVACGTGTQMSLAALPLPGDVALRQVDAYGCVDWRGCQATQFGRAQREDGISAAIADVMALIRDVPACTAPMREHWEGLYGYRRSVFNTFDNKHPYNDASDPAFSGWQRKLDCNDYSKKLNALKDARACLTSSAGKVACAQSLMLTPEVMIVLDLRVEGGACAKGNPFQPVASTQPYVSQRGGVGVLTWKCLDGKPGFVNGEAVPCRTIAVPPLTATDIANLAATMTAHGHKPDEVCGMPSGGGESIKVALLRWMSGARTEAELNMRRMEPFPTLVNSKHTGADICTLFRMAHERWGSWVAAQKAQDWRLAGRHGKAHRDVHTMLRIGPNPPNYFITLPWDGKPMEDQPVLTMRAAIDRWRVEHPAHIEELKRLGEMR